KIRPYPYRLHQPESRCHQTVTLKRGETMGWLIACILAVSLFHTRRRLKQLTVRYQFQHVTARSHAQLDPDTAPSSWASAGVSAFLYRNLSNLIILRLELGRLLAAKEIERVFYE